MVLTLPWKVYLFCVTYSFLLSRKVKDVPSVTVGMKNFLARVPQPWALRKVNREDFKNKWHLGPIYICVSANRTHAVPISSHSPLRRATPQWIGRRTRFSMRVREPQASPRRSPSDHSLAIIALHIWQFQVLHCYQLINLESCTGRLFFVGFCLRLSGGITSLQRLGCGGERFRGLVAV